MTYPFRSLFVKWSVCVMCTLAFAGCQSSKPGSASFASVTIHNRTVAEIQTAAGQVFREAGYAGGPAGGTRMVFEKEASRWTTMSRDGLVAAQEGARSLDRVRGEIVDLGGGSHRLQCEAFHVSGAGDSFFEEEVRLTNVRGGPYRSLLKKVEEKLK